MGIAKDYILGPGDVQCSRSHRVHELLRNWTRPSINLGREACEEAFIGAEQMGASPGDGSSTKTEVQCRQEASCLEGFIQMPANENRVPAVRRELNPLRCEEDKVKEAVIGCL